MRGARPCGAHAVHHGARRAAIGASKRWRAPAAQFPASIALQGLLGPLRSLSAVYKPCPHTRHFAVPLPTDLLPSFSSLLFPF